MNCVFRLGSHPQDISLCICRYSKVKKKKGNNKLKFETLLVPSSLDKGYSTCRASSNTTFIPLSYFLSELQFDIFKTYLRFPSYFLTFIFSIFCLYFGF